MTTAQKKTTKSKPKATTSSIDLPKNPFAFEVLHLVSKQRSKAKKVEVLKKYDDNSLRMLLIWNFDESVVSMLPSGEVPYSGYSDQSTYNGTLSTSISEKVRVMYERGSFSLGASDQDSRTTIRREAKNFYHFVKGGNDGLSSIRRETMFINVLEGLHPLEAELVCLAKDKKISEKYKITQEIVAEAYPDIVWGGRS